jgi:hypothetical protein
VAGSLISTIAAAAHVCAAAAKSRLLRIGKHIGPTTAAYGAAREAELVRAEAERRPHRRIEPGDAAATKGLDRVVERARALNGSVGKPLRERTVPLVELGRGGSQRLIGVRPVLGDAQEDPEGRRAGRAHRRPRSHAS